MRKRLNSKSSWRPVPFPLGITRLAGPRDFAMEPSAYLRAAPMKHGSLAGGGDTAPSGSFLTMDELREITEHLLRFSPDALIVVDEENPAGGQYSRELPHGREVVGHVMQD